MVELLPSILSADFAHLADEVAAAERGGGTTIHVDIMDGHFVPNITIGPPVVKSLRKATNLPLDCHLMIENPDEFIPAFADAGADWVSVHYEACRHLHRTLQLIALHGMRPGVVLNPATRVNFIKDILPMVHHVLIMSVNPGFGGQEFIPAFADAGANWVSVHYEVCRHLHRTLEYIAQNKMQPAVVINPHTEVDLLIPILGMVHHVLVMSVDPGFGGQQFIPYSLSKIRRLKELRRELGLS